MVLTITRADSWNAPALSGTKPNVLIVKKDDDERVSKASKDIVQYGLVNLSHSDGL